MDAIIQFYQLLGEAFVGSNGSFTSEKLMIGRFLMGQLIQLGYLSFGSVVINEGSVSLRKLLKCFLRNDELHTPDSFHRLLNGHFFPENQVGEYQGCRSAVQEK